MAQALIELRGAQKTYGEVVKTTALQPTDLSIEATEVVVVLGPSGSGKTTLLNLIGGLDVPSAGEVVVAGAGLSKMSSAELTSFRRDHVGFVFQFFNLIPTLTALENVETALAPQRIPRAERAERAKAALASVGLADRLDHLPAELSGGQQQRVAIARALVKNPTVLLADEPTGALDSAGGIEVLELFRRLHDGGQTIIMVTHSQEVAAGADRQIVLHDGHVASDTATAGTAEQLPA
jgi:putative ABC transport system ATP-binding protein